MSGLCATAQTESVAQVVPCETNSHQPTLKRREPVPANSTEDQNKAAIAGIPKCDSDEAQRLKDAQLVNIGFKGLEALDEFELRTRLEKLGVVFSNTRLPDADVVAKVVDLLKTQLRSEGYLEATVEAVTNEEARSLKFNVTQGPRLPIAGVKFSGTRVFDSDTLNASMAECVADIQTPEEEKRAPRMFEFCMRKATNLMRSQGYLQARLGERSNQITPTGLLITIPVIEGPLYRIGQITIEGAAAIPIEQLRSHLAVARGEVANGEALGKWLYIDIKELYGQLGYIEYSAELQPEFKPVVKGSDEGVVDLNVTIDEGQRFRLRSIRFLGTDLPEKEMRKLFLLKDGDIFNQPQFEAAIEKLNQSGWLEYVDKDRDCDFKTDEEEGMVSIVIKAVARNRGDSLVSKTAPQ
jgi:outer membrane protein insertion porin family